MEKRITGLDLARALAIFGMIIVNFKLAMHAEHGSAILQWFSALFEGRASALFVILAGVGITLLTNKARLSADSVSHIKARKSLLKRGALLIFTGLLYTPIWEADILHFYGFYFILAAILFTSSNRGLLISTITVLLSFPVLMIFFNYEDGWNWATLTYENIWNTESMIRHIFFNGFHPVFPWCSFLLLGMWLGRQDLSNPLLRRKLLGYSALTWIACESVFFMLRSVIRGKGIITEEEINFLLSTSMIPPLPQYIISAGSSALIILIMAIYIAEKLPKNHIIGWLSQTGKLSLSIYVAHVIIGMGLLEAFGKLENQSIEYSLLSSALFFTASVVFSVIWLKFFRYGPLEWLFRKFAS